jgi:ring-1,2-phenylacetyl-CoA epoxidase subunit PaaC
MNHNYIKHILHLADNALILGHRNSEWCGHGPVLEQDIAISNISLDLLGQARNLYQHAAILFNELLPNENATVFSSPLIQEKIKAGNNIDEDDFAYLREQEDYKNFLLLELPKENWGVTILRQYFFSVYEQLMFTTILNNSTDEQLKAIAAKSLKEIMYHVNWSADWVLRLGDGTEESHEKMQEALNDLYPYALNMFEPTGFENELYESHSFLNNAVIKDSWLHITSEKITTATLALPEKTESHYLGNGKKGIHTEHLSYILAEMQSVHRTFPNSVW